MKNLFLAFTLSFLSFFGFSQSFSITLTSTNFQGGDWSSTFFDDTVYLDPSESVTLNAVSPNSFNFATQPYIQGSQPSLSNATVQGYLPYNYTFQSGFADFAIYVIYLGNTASMNKMYKVLVLNNENQQTNSVNESNAVDFKLYPNPASNVLNIDTDYTGLFQVLDMSGRVLISTTNKQINVNDLTNGQYILKANQSTKLFIKK